MIVGELIRLLEAQDPKAVVLIPHDPGFGGGAEVVADVVSIPADQFRSGPAAANGAVRLSGLASCAWLVVPGLAPSKRGS